jgi:hypothetical protein
MAEYTKLVRIFPASQPVPKPTHVMFSCPEANFQYAVPDVARALEMFKEDFPGIEIAKAEVTSEKINGLWTNFGDPSYPQAIAL